MIDLSQGLLLGLSTLAHRPQVRPAMAQIAITNRCNTACRMCPRESLEVPDREMPLARALLAIDRLHGIRKVALVGLGEPLLHPDLDRIIAHAACRGIHSQVTSNGHLLDDDDRVRNLFESGLTHLAFSLEDLRGASSVGRRTRDIARIVERSLRIRDGLTGARPTVAVQVVLLDDARRSIEEIVRWADRIGVDLVNVSRANATFDPALKRPDPEGERRFFEVLADLRRRHRIRIDCFQDPIYPGVLGQAYRRMLRLARLETWCIKWSYYVYVDPDGDVFPCSGLFPKEMALGNLFSETLSEIWIGPRFRTYTLTAARDEYPRCYFPLNELSVCWDGSVPMCDNLVLTRPEPDVNLGNVVDLPLNALWNNERLTGLRSAHRKNSNPGRAVCRGCTTC